MFGRKDKIDSKELTLVGSNSRIDGDINFLGVATWMAPLTETSGPTWRVSHC